MASKEFFHLIPSVDSLANQFSQLMRSTLTTEQMDQIVEGNRTRCGGRHQDTLQGEDRVDSPQAHPTPLGYLVADIVGSKTRSRMMAGIRGKNTKPELLVRNAPTLKGYRYRLYRKGLPGRSDMDMPGRRIAIFIHGCFWHQHKGCRLAKMPSTRPDFWAAKLGANAARDRTAVSLLIDQGWRVLQVWECATKSLVRLQTLPDALAEWIEGAEPLGEVSA